MSTPAPAPLLKLWKFLGTTDEVTACDCCGRADLKSTVGLENLETGEIVHYGCVCAAHALKVTTKEIKAHTKSADRARELQARWEADQARRAEMVVWTAWLIERTGGIYHYDRAPNILAMNLKLQAELGNYAAIRAEFNAWAAARASA